MMHGLKRRQLMGIGYHDSYQIHTHSDYLRANKEEFCMSLTSWYQGLFVLSTQMDLLQESFFEVVVSGDFDEAFYVEAYHQALFWYRHQISLSRAMLLLTHCRQLFIMLADKKQNQALAKALCHSIDLAQSIVTEVFQMHDSLTHLRKKSTAEVARLRRSFRLISANAPEMLIQAYSDHQLWKQCAYACALGEVETDQLAFSTDECALGQWLNAGGLAHIPLQEQQGFTHAHEQVHQLGFRAVTEAKNHHPERIVDFLNDMELASDEVCRVLLDCIDNEFVRSASLDSLTGFPNKAAFEMQLSYNLSLGQRHGFWVGLIMVDIDYFKDINDQYGHHYGDLVLNELAELIKQVVRVEDQVYRWGGEEFAILSLDTSAEGVCQLAERLRAKVAGHTFCQSEQQSCHNSVSCGVISFSAAEEVTEQKLFKAADEQLYLAKFQGRNQVCFTTLTV